jgi:hypothetical protein
MAGQAKVQLIAGASNVTPDVRIYARGQS